MLRRASEIYRQYPSKFWVIAGASFVDVVGRTLIMPFFTLYVTQKFGVGMTQAGILLAAFSVSGFAGNMIGGALTDRLGRRAMILFGLVFSAVSSIAMGLVNELGVFYVLAVVVGLLSDVAGPAHGAMIADLLPEEKRAEGFGMLRVVANMAWIIGPTIGGLLATRSYLLLFVLDAVCSIITALIVFRLIPETRPQTSHLARQESLLQTFGGYRVALRDGAYVGFLLASIAMNLVYLQLYSTFSVFLRDVHGAGPRVYGMLMSMNATTVVLLQFWITRTLRRYAPMLMMALGTFFYMVGFGMYSFIAGLPLFALGMLLITIGEMIVMPISQALVSRLAPADMRGRYMAVFALAWQVPSAVGPWAAGIILDNFDPRLIWVLCGGISAIAIAGFLALHALTRSRLAPNPAPAPIPAS
jgi:MFS family permease